MKETNLDVRGKTEQKKKVLVKVKLEKHGYWKQQGVYIFIFNSEKSWKQPTNS